MWIPNFLTSLRICAALLFPIVAPEARVTVAVFSLVTEFLDGKIARMFYWETSLGRVLDPVADKIFALSFGITMVLAGSLKWPEFLLIVTRDILVGVGFLFAVFYYRNTKILAAIQPNFIGKATTFFQYAIFLYLLFRGKPPLWAIYFVGAWSAFSGILYIVEFEKHIHEKA